MRTATRWILETRKGRGTPLHRRATTPHVAGTNTRIRPTLPIRGNIIIGFRFSISARKFRNSQRVSTVVLASKIYYRGRNPVGDCAIAGTPQGNVLEYAFG
jgi:hypothetical protein